jgi:hypothetical protein
MRVPFFWGDRARIAQTVEEKRAVQRFRYEVYVEELGKRISSADHERRLIAEPEDDDPCAVHLYAGKLEDISGALRILCYPPGAAPQGQVERFSMGRFSALEDTAVSVSGRFVVKPSLRGKLVMLTLARMGYEQVLSRGVRLDFIYCAPGLVRSWRRLGYRPFGGDLVASEDGLRVPLVMAMHDQAFFASVGSPLARDARRARKRGVFDGFDPSPWAEIFATDVTGLTLGDSQVWKAVSSALAGDAPCDCRLFDGLDDAQVRKVVSKGFVIDVPDGRVVTRETLQERELFVILEGACEAVRLGERIAELRQGDLFGEVALFQESGRRTASVRSLGPARLLVLRRKALPELTQEDPELAVKLLWNLCTIMTRMGPAPQEVSP